MSRKPAYVDQLGIRQPGSVFLVPIENMSFFHHGETPNPPKKRNFLRSTVKDAFANCHAFCRKLSSPSPAPAAEEDDDDLSGNYDEEHEVFVSAVRSRYMEAKSRRKAISLTMDSFTWALSPTKERSFSTSKGVKQQAEESEGEDGDDFYSVVTRFTRSSSTTAVEAFVSSRPNLSRCSSLSSIDFPDFRARRHSIIRELSHCEGWPFGLCRKALLLPPLPKSPAESWLWRRNTRTVESS